MNDFFSRLGFCCVNRIKGRIEGCYIVGPKDTGFVNSSSLRGCKKVAGLLSPGLGKGVTSGESETGSTGLVSGMENARSGITLLKPALEELSIEPVGVDEMTSLTVTSGLSRSANRDARSG